ncbi:MAG TPA: hypothetical protein VGG36_07660 [Rhizomicrobium sp.]|jgi:hypothetical protein
MKPEVDQILNTCAMQLIGAIAPLLPASYSQSSASLLGFMMMFCAQEYDRAADIRAAENADMRALFADIAGAVNDAALRTKLEAAAKAEDASLKISALDAANHGLRKLLIEAQTHIETLGARDAEKKIWSVLRAAADRRVLKMPGS